MITWHDQATTRTLKSEFDFGGFHGFVHDTGSWYVFGHLAGYNVMASGDSRDMTAAKAAVEQALAKLQAAGMTGRKR